MKTLFLLASLPVFAANIDVIAEPTHTSVILRFDSANSPCLVEVSKSPTYAPVVPDVDDSLFSGSNSDAANTSVVKSGNHRDWQIGKSGKYGVATAGNGSNYSRALQAFTLHYFRVSCGGGMDTGTGTFTTKNIPMGSTHVWGLQADGSAGNWLQPTFSYTDATAEYIDPITGMLMKPIIGLYIDPDAETLRSVANATGASWTNPNNIAKAIQSVTVTDAGAGYLHVPTLSASNGYGASLTAVIDGSGHISSVTVGAGGAGYIAGTTITVTPDDLDTITATAVLTPVLSGQSTYSGTAQAKLVAQTFSIRGRPLNNLVWIAVKVTGFGDGATGPLRTVQMCWSLDGATCVLGSTIIDLVLPSSSGDVYYNGPTPAVGNVMGWPFPSLDDVANGNGKLLIWKKATSGSDTISLDNAQVWIGESPIGEESSGGFHQVSGRKDSSGFQKTGLSNGLFALNADTGEHRYLGYGYFYNSAIPGLRSEGVGACVTFGAAGQLWDPANPNYQYCNVTLLNGDPALLRFTMDATNTAVTNPAGYFAYTAALILTPSTSTLDALVQSYAAAQVPAKQIPLSQCQFDAIQSHWAIGSCRTGEQNSFAYSIVFDLGNGTAMDDASCGSIVAGRCSNSGVGLVAIQVIYENDLCRWCGLHTTLNNGPNSVVSLEPGGLNYSTPLPADAESWVVGSGAFHYGTWPPSVTFTNSLSPTDTLITLTSAWDTSIHSQAGTVTSAPSAAPGNSTIAGTGTQFAAVTTKGDTVCFTGGQCSVIFDISEGSAGNTVMQVRPALSPDVTNVAWTSQWPAQPANFRPGQPVGLRYPRHLTNWAVGDFFHFGQANPWGAVTISTTTVPFDTMNGTGTTFLSNIGVGNRVCMYNNCGIVGSVDSNTKLTLSTPAGFNDATPGVPYTVNANIGGTGLAELGKIEEIIDDTHIRVGRNCSQIYPQACTGTGMAQPAGTPASIISPYGGSIADVQNASGAAFFWDFIADPNAMDTNINDPCNTGLHATVRTFQPCGLNGNHETFYGAIHRVAGVGTVVALGGAANRASLTLPSNYLYTDYYPFAGVYSPSQGVTYQSHPANQHAAYCAENSGLFYFCLFFMDGRPLIGGTSGVASPVEGNVYKVPLDQTGAAEARLAPKKLPTLAVCGTKALQNISGPSSHIVDSATVFQVCTANAAGECRNAMDMGGASVAGDSFVNCPGANTHLCSSGEQFDLANKDICVSNGFFTANSTTRYNVRMGADPTVVINEGPRRVQVARKMGMGPRLTSQYSNGKTLEGGGWFMAGSYGNTGKQLFMAKLPPVPMLDSIVRDNFSFVNLKINAPAGTNNVVVKFGYDSTFKCASDNYDDVCIAAASNNPYFFASEMFSGVSCATSCSIDIPFFPANVGWYQVIFRNSSDATVASGPVQLVVVP